MAGILLGDRVYAIIETNGATQVVQPGDYTTDRLAIVQRIEPDKVVLKTVDEKPRTVTVRMAASPTVQSPSVPSTPSGPSRSGYSPPGVAPPPPPGIGGPPGGRPGEPP
jgi:type II secretory pathway component PulC